MSNFIANPNTYELHYLAERRAMCKLGEIARPIALQFTSWNQVKQWLNTRGYDGCKHCLPGFHTR